MSENTSLFELTGKYRELYAMLADDPDSEVVNDTLEAIIGEIAVKGEGYVGLLNQLAMEEDACEKQEALWKYRKEVKRNAQKRLKERLVQAMEAMGVKEIQAGATTIKLRNNGGQLPLIINGDVPPEYMKTKIIQEKDGEKIRKALDEGKKLDFAAYGQRGKSVRW